LAVHHLQYATINPQNPQTGQKSFQGFLSGSGATFLEQSQEPYEGLILQPGKVSDPKPRKAEEIIIQVKGGKPGVKVVRDLRGVLEREKAAMGVLISLQPPTRDMVAEVVSASFYGHKIICGMGEGWSRLAATMQLKDALLNRRDAIDVEAKPPPNRAKRLECVEHAPAFGRAAPFESASKLVALQTLRVTVHPGNQSGRRLKRRQRHG
jgi:hypothetical protein